MPTYDYRCLATNEVFEVSHSMQQKLTTWGELCGLLNRDPGAILHDSPVEKLITHSNVIRSSTLKNPEAPTCGKAGCGGGFCGMN